jgi:peptidoglycan/LPS O-acetylase OafA/YrhL
VTAFDGFRGVAIIMVVVAHASGWGWDFYQTPGGQVNFYFSLVTRNLAFFSLPLFLIVSGYWLATVHLSTRADYLLFLRKRFSRIAVPYVVWSVLLLGQQAVRSGSYSPGEFVEKLLLGQADGPYYFILLMLQFYLLAPFFLRWSQHGGAMAALVALHVLVIAGLYFVRVAYDPGLPYTVVKLPFWTWLSLFPLGMWLRRHPETAHRYGVGALAAGAAAFFALSMAESVFLLRQGSLWFDFAISDIRIPSMLFGVLVTFAFFQYRDREWPRALVTLGEYSFGIFFIHGVILRGTARGLREIPGLYDIQPAYQILMTALTLALCCVVIALTRRILGREFSSRVLGF